MPCQESASFQCVLFFRLSSPCYFCYRLQAHWRNQNWLRFLTFFCERWIYFIEFSFSSFFNVKMCEKTIGANECFSQKRWRRKISGWRRLSMTHNILKPWICIYLWQWAWLWIFLNLSARYLLEITNKSQLLLLSFWLDEQGSAFKGMVKSWVGTLVILCLKLDTDHPECKSNSNGAYSFVSINNLEI